MLRKHDIGRFRNGHPTDMSIYNLRRRVYLHNSGKCIFTFRERWKWKNKVGKLLWCMVLILLPAPHYEETAFAGPLWWAILLWWLYLSPNYWCLRKTIVFVLRVCMHYVCVVVRCTSFCFWGTLRIILINILPGDVWALLSASNYQSLVQII